MNRIHNFFNNLFHSQKNQIYEKWLELDNSINIGELKAKLKDLPNIYNDLMVESLMDYKRGIVVSSLKDVKTLQDMSFRNGTVTAISHFVEYLRSIRKVESVNSKITGQKEFIEKKGVS